MGSRRNFIRSFFAATAGASLMSFKELQPKVSNRTAEGLPILLCSRGRDWGMKVLEPAWSTLGETGNVLDAIEAGANVVELDPEDTSVGYGGLPNERGVVQLDASIMYGPNHNCGSVAALENIKKASSVARKVMERSDHIHIVGKGALEFAKAHGFREEEMLTDRSRRIWLRWKENLSEKDDWLPPADNDYGLEERSSGTINVLGIDKDGNIAGITTTSGLFGKIPGRVGDSPIIGAGLYVDNEVGAAGATGRGEEVIRTCGSFHVVEKMRQGMSPQEACESICERIIDINGGRDKVNFNDKFVAVNKDGEVGCAMIRGRKEYEPRLSYYTENGFNVYTGKYLIEIGG